MVEKLIKWLLFSAVISLVPICATYVILLSSNNSPSFISLICRGELQLISVALLANGIGEIVANDTINKIIKLLLTGVSTILLLIISIWYGSIVSSLISSSINTTNDFLVLYTLIAFIASFVISGCCISIGGE